MSVNIFAILDDSDNEEAPVVKKDDKKDKKKEEKKAGNKNTAAAPAVPAPAPVAAAAKTDKASGKENSKSKGNENGDKKSSNNNRKENAPAKADASKAVPVDAEVEVSKPDNRGGRGRGEGGRGRGDRREGGGDRKPRREGAAEGDRPPRKREFDRRNASGRSGEQRRDGRGPYSTGNIDEEAQLAEKDPASAEPEIETPDVVDPATEEEAAVVQPEPEPVVDNTKTYDEFIAKRNEARANSELFGAVTKIRAPETVTDLKAKEEDLSAFIEGKAKSTPKVKVTQRSTTKTQVLDVAFKRAVQEEDREDRRGGRGGRGYRPERERTDRPNRGGGGGRGGGKTSPRSQAPGGRIDVFDANNFPSLLA